MDASEAVSTLIVEMSFLLPEDQASRLRSVLITGQKAAAELRLSNELDEIELGVALVQGTVEESYRRRRRSIRRPGAVSCNDAAAVASPSARGMWANRSHAERGRIFTSTSIAAEPKSPERVNELARRTG